MICTFLLLNDSLECMSLVCCRNVYHMIAFTYFFAEIEKENVSLFIV